jgi:uncharacterized membrane protein
MNEQDRWDLDRLKERHDQLSRQMAALASELNRVESRFNAAAPAQTAKTPVAPSALEAPGQAAPKPPLKVRLSPPTIGNSPLTPSVPPPEPPRIPLPVAPSAAAAPAPPQPIPIPPALPQPTAPVQAPSFEMRLGTYWFVRIGIVMVLTALAFFGSYAYQNFIVTVGPAGKVCLLYLASGILLGAGAWCC